MRLPVILSVCFATICFSQPGLLGSDVTQLAGEIDHQINKRLAEEHVQPTATLDPAGFLRRATLDLAGRIPSVSELDAFLAADPRDRKQQLVQRLVDSPDFAFHQRNQLDLLLLLPQEHNQKWREYLLEATRENRPWDQLFREVMLPDETLDSDPRPVAFLKRRTNDLDAMTNDSSVTWFGVNIACAKCHDHPLVSDWTQAHYFGMAAFFKRTFQTRKGFLSERFDGTLKYTNIDGEEHEAELMFLTGTTVEVPALELTDDELKKLQERIKKSEQDDKADAPPRPEFRPRARLVEIALADDEHRFFARNITNRIWARMLGRGLVNPLDQLHSENEASHPKLLSELADDLRSSGYDLKRLIQAIALTDAYARDVARGQEAKSIDPEWFAAGTPRALSPRQLALSLRIASMSPVKIAESQTGNWDQQRDQLERQADGMARNLEIPTAGFQVPVGEALWFSNHQSIESDLLNGSNDRLVGYLKEIESDDEAAAAAIKSVLSREPNEEECKAIVEYLGKRADRREQGLKQTVWALMGSPEFRFNH